MSTDARALTLTAVARALGGEIKAGQVLAPGPGHSANDRSLSVKLDAGAPDGFLCNSFAADDPIVCRDYVREKCGLGAFKPNGTRHDAAAIERAVLAAVAAQSRPAIPRKPSGHIVATYDYANADGTLLYQVVRLDPKDFRQRQPDGNGWIWHLGDIPRVPYRLPELLRYPDGTVFVCEGEKDADRVAGLGLCATTAAGGKWTDDCVVALRGRDIIILQDNDDAGRKKASELAALLYETAKSLRVVALPGLPDKGDVSDWLDADRRRGADDLGNVCMDAPLWTLAGAPEPPKPEAAVATSASTLISSRAAAIAPEPIEWIWPGRLARGKHSCVGGEPGTGKSQLSLDIVSTITTGGTWPCNEGRAPVGNAVILSAEDGVADTIIPRLVAAGADLGRVEIVTAAQDARGRRTVSLQTDLALLEQKIAAIGDVGVVVIDPISSYLGQTDSHKNAEVRGVLEPLSALAERTGVALLSVTHFSKSNAGGKALHRFIGSIAFVGAPRAAFVVIEDPDDASRRLFLHAKNNLAPPPQGLSYRLGQTIVTDRNIVASRIYWEAAAVNTTANEAMAADADGSDPHVRREAEELLREMLCAGPVPVNTIKAEANGAGISWATMRRAQKRLRVHARKSGLADGWTWETTEDAHPEAEGAHSKG